MRLTTITICNVDADADTDIKSSWSWCRTRTFWLVVLRACVEAAVVVVEIRRRAELAKILFQFPAIYFAPKISSFAPKIGREGRGESGGKFETKMAGRRNLAKI